MSVDADVRAVQCRVAAIAGEPVAAPRPEASRAGTLDGRAFEHLVRSAAARAGLRPEFVAAVAQTESGFNPAATSAGGAEGLMQLMPATARALGIADPYDPAANVRGGATYLRELLDRFGGDVRLALAAYNAGPGAVARYGGVPPFAETQTYVVRVLDAYRAALRSEQP